MLRPAQLYKDKLAEENIMSWYDPRNIYWNGGAGDSWTIVKRVDTF